jgi:hypothetical protein
MTSFMHRHFQNKINTIRFGNKTVGLMQMDNYYILGFPSATHARAVQFSMVHDPTELTFVRQARGTEVHAVLHIPKVSAEEMMDPWNDVGFHIQPEPFEEFLMTPFNKGVGVIMPYDLLDETEEAFTFESQLIEPNLRPNLFKNTLRL